MEQGFIISKVETALINIFRGAVKKEFDMEAEQVLLCAPGEGGNFAVGIYLYDIRKNSDLTQYRPQPVGVEESRQPSAFYDLYYMIVPHSDGDRKYRMEEEHKLLDVLLQTLGDTHFLTLENEEQQTVKIEFCDINYEEKAKIWNGLNQPMQVALFCQVGPVEVKSAKKKRISRVTDIQIDFV